MSYLGLQLLSALAVVATLALTGASLTGLLPRTRSSVGRLCDLVAAGAFLWMCLAFALASTGLYRPPVLVVSAFATSALGAVVLWRNRGVHPEIPTDDVPGNTHLPARAPLLVAIGVVLAVLCLHALRPNVAWDANVYHLTLPRLFLESGGFVSQPMLVYAHWPLGTDLLFGLAMSIHGHVTAKLLHFAFGALTLLATARLAVHGGGAPVAGTLAAGLVLMNPVVQYEMRIAYIDLATAFFLATAALHLLRSLRSGSQSDSDQHALLAGLAVAAMVGSKLNGFFGLVALGAATAAFVAAKPALRARRQLLTRAALRVLAPSIVLGGAWLAKSTWLTGNPVYPLLFGVFGGPHWSPELGAQHSAWQQAIGMGRSPVDYLLLPYRVIFEGALGYATFDGALHWLWALAALAALPAVWRDLPARALAVGAATLFVLWALSSQQMRFLIPALPLVAACAVRGLHLLLRDRSRAGLTWGLCGLAVAGAALHVNLVYMEQTGRLGRDLVRHGQRLEQAIVHPTYRWIDATLAPEARLLLINTNHGFYLRRSYIADSFFEASQIADATRDLQTADEGMAWLQRHRITHILLEQRPRGIPFSEGLIAAVASCGVIHTSPDGRFEVRAVPTRTATR